MAKIGVLKERKHDERRVALRPDHAKSLVAMGHEVWVEHDAALAIGIEDVAYVDIGARVVEQKEVYERAELLLKVKCPLGEEFELLRPQHVLFTYLHFDENIPPAELSRLVDTGVTGIAYEWVEKDGQFPLLQPMSELTGAVFARKAMSLLMEEAGFLGGAYHRNWGASTAMVIGAGHIGANALNVFMQNQFRVIVVDKHPETLRQRLRPYVDLHQWDAAKAEIIPFDESAPAESAAAIRARLNDCDIVICAAVRRPSLPKEKCEFLIRRQDLATMRDRSVICDATACDRDFIETCVSSDSLRDWYTEDGVIHYNCDHIPSLVANTATTLLTDASFPYVQLLAGGFIEAVRQSPALARGVMCYRGKLVHAFSAEKKGLAYTDLAMLL